MNDRGKIRSCWHGMLRRCYWRFNKAYKYYGGRGITVLEEWHTFEPFYVWSKDRYKLGYTLDRIDNDKGYSPENCRYVTYEENNCNRGRQANNTSGYIGVCWRKAEQNWEAKIRYQRKGIYLGRFATAEAALGARNAYIKDNKLPFPIQRVG